MSRPATQAYIELDLRFDGIRLAVVRRHSSGTDVRVWHEIDRTWARVAEHTVPNSDEWLRLEQDTARAVYEALADHFGHGTNDVRALRRDHDAERARVDKLTDAIITIASR
jgi:hypothetical protein